ncbi:LLM class flavin-dependent oxidoreductase [Nonomuraea sp. PA05]|uniref:LLM class flavin-dependent oxidoreductase n=1 Tax=Nonomuraea sp. PA05 TaxID=2604466 RepID=UPI0011D7BF61|nr:LLM class flavin-dependent oxidoreductase [Nonomuraea sp. PA05]TYB59524.1 LLM class flavin-dependent oxidoreductase [Nonomuraea sp. PA05]
MSRLELGTGIPPRRDSLVLAKQAAGLDVLSGGRPLLGVAGGYPQPEPAAPGVPRAWPAALARLERSDALPG